MVHVGVDLHKRSSQLAVLMPDGEVTQQRLENNPTKLDRFFAQVPRGARVAIEASGTWWWFVDLVERLGHHAILSNPTQTKAIAAARLKDCLALLRVLDEQIRRLDHELVQRWGTIPECSASGPFLESAPSRPSS